MDEDLGRHRWLTVTLSAYVTFGDINEERGKSIAEELGQYGILH